MAACYSVIKVLPEWGPQTEGMGSKSKFWYLQPGDTESYWLFKYPRPERGEHWAEKLAAEVAGLSGIDCARVELAVFRGKRGSIAKSLTDGNRILVHGNEILESVGFADAIDGLDFHLSDHTLENIWMALDITFESGDAQVEAKTRFAEYLVLDAIIGNTDRHSENWGILRSNATHIREGRPAPSYDHGSSLGRELTDKRRELLLADNRIGDYVERGRGQIYWRNVDRRGPSPLALVRFAVSEYPELLRPAIAKLDNLDEPALRQIVDSIPEEWMTPVARTFAFELMRYSCNQLRETI